MNNSRGSISVILLLTCLLLVGVTHLILTWTIKENEKVRQYVITTQLRNLLGSFYKLRSAEGIMGRTILYDGVWQPGNYQVLATANTSYNSDGLIEYLEYEAQAKGLAQVEQRLRRITINFSDVWRKYAKNNTFLAINFTGLQYLTQDALYIHASKEEVKPPDVSMLKNKCINSVSSNEFETIGITTRFYYMNGSNEFIFSGNNTFHGGTVFINQAAVTIGSNAYFPDRIVILSLGSNVRIGKNVRMDNVLIISPKTVTIDAGCNITGFIVGNSIKLLGPSTFTPDENVVAPFPSLIHIN